ncbi:MAG: hypothetical protein V7606_1372 [Burkholderiales bacterium]|jgi:hypothetical protein
MEDQDFITATNYEKVRIVMQIVRDMVPDFDGVITHEDRACVIAILEKWQDGLFAATKG